MTARRLTNAKRAPGSQSLERGLDILEMIEAEGGDVGVRELARRLGLSPTIVQRLISSLALRGYIEKNSETARYRLGHRSLVLGASGELAFDYAVAARRELERLAHDHRLNGFVSVLRGGRAIYLLAVQADGPVAIKVSPGSEMPLHSTSAGKVLLASLGDGEARKLLGGRKLAAITAHTVTDPAVLVASLAKVRRQGFATVNEENIPGVLSVGAPDPRSRGRRRGGAERGLSQVSRRRPDAAQRRAAGDRCCPAHLAHAWHAACYVVDWNSGSVSGGK